MSDAARGVADPEGRRWIPFTSSLVEELEPADELARAIEEFESLAYPAGVETADWLRGCLRGRNVPYETHVVQAPDGALLGFYAMSPLSFELSRDDYAKLAIRAKRDIGHRPQPGRLLELIARSRNSEPGFGKTLFTNAVAHALAGKAVALLLQPRGEIAHLWTGPRYDCRVLEPVPGAPGYDPPMLWYPVWEPAEPEWP